MVKPCRRRGESLLTILVSEAFEVAEGLVDDGRTMLCKAFLVLEVSVTIVANPVGQTQGRDLSFVVRSVDFIRQMLLESLLINEIAVTVAAVELCCVNG